MSIKKRLIVSHLLVFIVPVIMMVLIVLISGMGIMAFARSGNHIYIENETEFQYMHAIVRQIALHHVESGSDPVWSRNFISLIAPDQNLIVVSRENERVYSYGNLSMFPLVGEIVKKCDAERVLSRQVSTYSYTRNDEFAYLEKFLFDNTVYTLCFVSRQARQNEDKVLDNTIHITVYCIIFSLVLIVLATSWFLSHFILRHILQPLNALQSGAEQIREGNLGRRLAHQENDEIRPVMEAFNLMAEKLSESLEERELQEKSRKELVARISHDLRTPLTTIKAYVEGLLQQVADTPEKQARYLNTIHKKADEMSHMIEQLLLFSKIECGEQAAPLEPVELTGFLQDFVIENHYSWEKEGAIVRVPDAEKITVAGNTMLLSRILTNIISNSAKYKIEENIHCEIRLKTEAHYAVIEIQDNGPGVPEEVLPHLFEPFYRTDKARSRTKDGSGLGLTIARKATEAQGGIITAQNAFPHGLTVVLKLPLKGGGA